MIKKLLLISSSIIIFIILIYLFVATPHQVIGSDGTILQNQTYFSEKMTYMFRQPQVGDIINFKVEQDDAWSEFIGIITKEVTGNYSKNTSTTSYLVVNSTDPVRVSKTTWTVTQDKITGRVYYPQVRLTQDQINEINSNLK